MAKTKAFFVNSDVNVCHVVLYLFQHYINTQIIGHVCFEVSRLLSFILFVSFYEHLVDGGL